MTLLPSSAQCWDEIVLFTMFMTWLNVFLLYIFKKNCIAAESLKFHNNITIGLANCVEKKLLIRHARYYVMVLSHILTIQTSVMHFPPHGSSIPYSLYLGLKPYKWISSNLENTPQIV